MRRLLPGISLATVYKSLETLVGCGLAVKLTYGDGSARYDGRWRERDPASAPAGVDPVIRLKMPLDGTTVIDDQVQGEVSVANDQLDDMVLLRADGSPTYMLAVVVDDHDMGVTHVIRGDDHLNNAARQMMIYQAMGTGGWNGEPNDRVALTTAPGDCRHVMTRTSI